MIVTERPRRRPTEGVGQRTRQCDAYAGCHHAARFDAVFLGSYSVALCSKHADEWRQTYDNALGGWPDEVAA